MTAPSRLLERWAGALARVPTGALLAGGTVALLLLRLGVSLARSGPVIMADEAGYLLNARVIGGGMAAEMGSSPTYRGGYSLLIAPVVSLFDDPVAAYHAVLVVNALLAASLVGLLYLMLTRGFGVAPRAAAWAALAGAAYPSVTVLSQVALSESALFALMTAWLLAAGGLLRARHGRRAAAWAAGTGLSAAALWTVHGRMVVVAGLTALVLAGILVGGRGRRAAAATGLALLAGGMLAGRALNDWLVERNWDGRGFDEAGHALSPMHSAAGALDVLRNVAGQGWYVVVATLGVALLLVGSEAPAALARLRARRADAGDALLALLLATTAGLLVLSALWFATTTRPDQLIYGRYVEPVLPALVAVGAALLARAESLPRPRTIVVALGVSTLAVAALRSGLDAPGLASRWNVAALPSATGALGVPIIVLAGAVASAAALAIVAVRRRAPAAIAPLLVVLFVPTTAYSIVLPVLRSEHDVYPAGWESPRPVVEDHRLRTVAYDLAHFDHVRVKVYQWFLPDTPMLLFDGRRAASPAPAFFGGTPPGAPARPGARPLWSDPGADQALWPAR